MNSAARRLCIAVPTLALLLAGCATTNGAPGSASPDRIANASPHNALVTASVESLQQQVWPGDWIPAAGGNLLVLCDANASNPDTSTRQDGDYLFYGSWSTTGEWEMPVDLEATVDEFSNWLSAAGWSDIGMESSESPEYWRVWATHEEDDIAEAMVTWYPAGNIDAAQPHAVLDVDSTCSPADAEA